MPDAREYELKFEIAIANVPSLTAHPAIAAAFSGARPSKLIAIYFDTPDRRLSAQSIILRIRDQDGVKTETVKQAGASFVDRGEWNFETDDTFPNLDRLGDSPLREVFLEPGLKDKLVPVFTITVERTAFMLMQGEATIEAAIDRGEIEADDRRLPISEFELELKSGEPADLFVLSRQLVEAIPLTASLISKAERGFRLLDSSWGHPVKPGRPRLRPEMTIADAFRGLAEACLHDIMLNVAAFAPGSDIEAVHRGRVALRRLRAAMTLFKPRIEDEQFEQIRQQLKWISDLLGAARDFDVFQSEIFDPAAEDNSILGGRDLADHMRTKQRAAQETLAEALRSQRWRLLLNDLIAWMSAGPWLRSAAHDEDETLVDFIRPRLKTRRKHLVRESHDLDALTANQRHEVRKDAKKLRYMLEFFEDVPGLGEHSKAYRKLQRALGELQESLGQLHDHDAKHDLLQAECLSWTPTGIAGNRVMFAAGVLSGSSPDIKALLKEAKSAYKMVQDSEPF